MTSSSPSCSLPTSSSPGDVGGGCDRQLDLRGEICPFTFVRTKLALEEMPIGATLRVIVDHEPAVHTVPRSVREWGQKIVAVSDHAPGAWQIDLEKQVP